MKEHTLFVVEKLSTLRKLAPHLSCRWPGKVYAITTLYLGLYEFRYPRGLGMAAFPFVGEPTWKVRHQEQSPAFEIQGDEAHRCALDPVELLRGASSICFAADPDPAGAVAFHVLLSECLGDASARANWPALRLHALDERSISSALDTAGATSDNWFASMRNAGIARRFFDFNYNVNALAVFGQALRQVGGLSRDYLVSKYSLQLLYALRNQPPACSDAALMHAMQEWQGTGRYAASSMGSPASRPAILAGLRSAGLVDGLELAASGWAFLNRLHPDCCDQDLPGRIGQWEQDWPLSRPMMERYLRTFFGKQKRYTQALLKESKP